MIKLNLGSGHQPLDGFVNVDQQPAETPDVCFDIGRDPWPFENSSVDEVMASHVLEHIGPDPAQFMHCMKELYRVCADGARVHVRVPNPRHDIFLHDPTHVRPVTPITLMMFDRKACAKAEAENRRMTPFCEYLGVDFELKMPVGGIYDPHLDPEKTSPEALDWLERYANNVIAEFHMELTVRK